MSAKSTSIPYGPNLSRVTRRVVTINGFNTLHDPTLGPGRGVGRDGFGDERRVDVPGYADGLTMISIAPTSQVDAVDLYGGGNRLHNAERFRVTAQRPYCGPILVDKLLAVPVRNTARPDSTLPLFLDEQGSWGLESSGNITWPSLDLEVMTGLVVPVSPIVLGCPKHSEVKGEGDGNGMAAFWTSGRSRWELACEVVLGAATTVTVTVEGHRGYYDIPGPTLRNDRTTLGTHVLTGATLSFAAEFDGVPFDMVVLRFVPNADDYQFRCTLDSYFANL